MHEAIERRKRRRRDAARRKRGTAVAEISEHKANAAQVRRERKARAAELRRQRKALAVEARERRVAAAVELREQRVAEEAAVLAAEGPQVRKRRRWTMWFGLCFVAVGLSMLGYVGWQLWGTNWVSHRKQERIVEDVRQEWNIAESSTLTPNGTPVVHVPEGAVSAMIRIPEFGRDYVVPVLEGTSDKVLAAGFGHFDDTADPGQVGNYALAAHRVTHGEPLRDMPELEPGDKVIVETIYATYTYVLTTGGEDLRVTFKDGWVVAPLPKNPDPNGVQPKQIPGQKLITLTTCAELFHTDDRLVAFGILKSVVEKPTAEKP